MKRILLLLLLAICSTGLTYSQSVEIQPDGDIISTGPAPDLFLRARLSNSNAPEINTERSRSSGGSPAAILNNNHLFRLKNYGYNGTSYVQSADMLFEASENWDAGGRGTDFRLKLAPNNSNSMQEWFTILNNGNVGFGSLAPTAKVEVSNSSAGNDTPSLKLLHTSATGYNRLSFENLSRTDKYLISATVGSSAASSRWNVYHSATGNLLTVSGDGNIGMGTSNPTLPLHLNKTNNIISSSTGAFAIGSLTSTHLNFDNNEINAWNNTSGNTLFLNFWSQGKVQIGNGASGADLDVNGFTNLGDGAPKIKMKKFSGTTDADSQTLITHGLSFAKILDVSVFINNSSNNVKYPPQENSGSSFEYRVYVNTTNIGLANVSSGLQGRTYTVLVTYEE